MRGMLTVMALGLMTACAMAQPADCPPRPASPGPSQRLSINLAGRPGVPSGVTGRTVIEVPLAAPQTECGEPSAPADVLRGAPGDLLLGTPAPAPTAR